MIAEDREIFDTLCMACRAGDIESVDKIVSSGVNINQVDEWDYSPLILASLCGHEKVVKFLLQRGAVCDRDTFEGARCIYGALTDSIRNTLLSYDISKSVDITQPFASHISSLLGKSKITSADIVFKFPNDRSLQLNRFLLYARCPYFRSQLSHVGSWYSKEVVDIKTTVDYDIFQIVVDYIYLVADVKFDSVQKERLVDYVKNLCLPDLLNSVELYDSASTLTEISKSKHKIAYALVEKARDDLKQFVEEMVFSKKTIIKIPETAEWRDEIDVSKSLSDEERMKLFHLDSSPDVLVSAVDEDSIIYYPCHKSILVRSEYFETMFKSSFHEAVTSNLTKYDTLSRNVSPEEISIIQLDDTCSKITEIVLGYLYFDEANIPEEHAIDVLFVADRLFIERLKSMAAVSITTSSNFEKVDTIYNILRAGWDTRVHRLELFVAEKIANDLNRYIMEEEFAAVIVESAERIKGRQETDTIELIDDVRFYLAKKYAIDDGENLAPERIGATTEYHTSDLYEFHEQSNKIDELLVKLGLDA